MSDAPAPSATGGRRKGAWLAHVKKTMKAQAGLKKSMGKKWFTHVLKSAKKSYHKKGGADSASDEERKPWRPLRPLVLPPLLVVVVVVERLAVIASNLLQKIIISNI
jgi:hypothetical protein